MKLPYLAHIPFVALYLAFALCFVVAQAVSRRR
jgi:hypothetical protein